MILKSINYSEHNNKPIYWAVKDIAFNEANLIVGVNATGKTRLVNIITNLAGVIQKKNSVIDGEWDVSFYDKIKKEKLTYQLKLANKNVRSENLTVDGVVKLVRNGEGTKIYSDVEKKMIDVSPPENELLLHVRRDTREYPFLENLLNWANTLNSFKFITPDPYLIPIIENHMIVDNKQEYLNNLTFSNYLLKNIAERKDAKLLKLIKEDIIQIGYSIEKIEYVDKLIPPYFTRGPVIVVKEEDLNCETDQTAFSNGMYRAISLIIYINYLASLNAEATLIIDDLGEGLDFDRSAKLTKLIFERIKGSKIQMIATSNHRFLINAVDLDIITVLDRKGHEVKAYNYTNSKKQFDDFKKIGLNNFDFLTTGSFLPDSE